MRSIFGRMGRVGLMFLFIFLLLPGVLFACALDSECLPCQACTCGACVVVPDGTACGTCKTCTGGVCGNVPNGTSCGVCQTCTAGACGVAPFGTPCGTCKRCTAGACLNTPPLPATPCMKNCDSSDTPCRDYSDVVGTCDGSGSCTAVCAAVVYKPATTYCGAGACLNCNPLLGTCVTPSPIGTPCGTCQSCNALGACVNSIAGTSCPQDCDTLDNCCRDYNDISSTCNGSGSCNVGLCSSYANKPASASCATCMNCSGAGVCINSASGTSCAGTTNCDTLDWTCRDYHTVSQACDGAGTCGSGSCTSYTDLSVSCGTVPNPCSVGTGCYCSGNRYWCANGASTSCTSFCSGGACSACTPSSCSASRQGTNSDGDAYDSQCGDCNDSNSRVFPGNPNLFCDCDAGNPAATPSSTGISELTGCVVDATSQTFKAGCLCLDAKDNDCDGLVDFADTGDCPDPAKIWYIQTAFTLTVSQTVNSEVYVLNGGTLTIPAGVILTIRKPHQLHVAPGGSIDPLSAARIRFL